MSDKNSKTSISYADTGVDIKAGEEAVDRIKSLAAATFDSNVLTGLGMFGGFYKPDFSGISNPVLVSSTDSVGTKVKLAFMTGIHNTVGADLVNHCINDILVGGARGMFFLDYIGIDKVIPEVIAELVDGLSGACKANRISLIGGETAELPDFYSPGEYDLVGFVIGIVDEEKIIDGSAIKPGDVCLGLPSNGLHTNGYTLARKVAFEIAGLKPDDRVDELGMTIAEALMQVHISYAPVILPLLDKFDIHGMAHITGGGIPGNLKRILPKNISAEIDKSSWPSVPIFEYLKRVGNIDPDDIYSAFNMGIGYMVVASEDQAHAIKTELDKASQPVYEIGRIVEGDGTVRLIG